MPVKTKTKKEFDYQTIKSFEDACKKTGIDPNKLPDVSMLPEETQKSVIAHYKLIVIYKAINNGWKPDWSNWDQRKYYPWYEVLSSGFGFSDSGCSWADTYSDVGSRLCTDSYEKAMFIAETFKDEYRDFLLFQE